MASATARFMTFATGSIIFDFLMFIDAMLRFSGGAERDYKKPPG
jgi:hypothetical protein